MTETRHGWLNDMAEPEPDGHFVFSNGRRVRARWRGDRKVVAQPTVTPDDPDTAAEAARLNELHEEIFGRG